MAITIYKFLIGTIALLSINTSCLSQDSLMFFAQKTATKSILFQAENEMFSFERQHTYHGKVISDVNSYGKQYQIHYLEGIPVSIHFQDNLIASFSGWNLFYNNKLYIFQAGDQKGNWNYASGGEKLLECFFKYYNGVNSIELIFLDDMANNEMMKVAALLKARSMVREKKGKVSPYLIAGIIVSLMGVAVDQIR